MAIEYDHRVDHYIALGIASTATHDDIRKAHRALIRELHPDRGGESKSAAQVNIARDVLLSPITRQEYDDARRDWHERNPVVSILLDAGQPFYGCRPPAPQAPPDEPSDARAAHVQPASSPHDSDAVQSQPPNEWRVDIATTLVADEFMRAMLSRQWLNAIAIIGSAYILDRVIENRVANNPARREALNAIATEIRQHHARRLAETFFMQAGYRWDATTDRWILQVSPSGPPK
jgi:curved DNA-binding protein CbpA